MENESWKDGNSVSTIKIRIKTDTNISFNLNKINDNEMHR